MSLFFLSFLICFSVHACSARSLGFFVNEKRNEVFTKGLVPISENQEAQGQEFLHDGRTHQNLLGATTEQDVLEAFLAKQGTKRAVSGHKAILSSPRDFPQQHKIKELKRQGRSILGSTSYDSEEAEESKEKAIVEDIVVTDYAQPHRKPPIHNEKP